METFISCDWGTSAFRLRLVNAETLTIAAEVKLTQGIAVTNGDWKKQAGMGDRFSFYYTVISEAITQLEQQCGFGLNDTTIIISGMASASIGMIELPYKTLPFYTDGRDLSAHIISESAGFRQRMIIISGAKTGTDVMRGEETMLVGCNISRSEEEQLLIFPGTHSKHIRIQEGTAVDFKTFMTGELFNLLCKNSVLAASVEVNDSLHEKENKAAFCKGVEAGATTNVLNNIFHVRTNQLFNYYTPPENYHYLSGILVGAELEDVLTKQHTKLTLVSTPALAQPYLYAMEALHVSNNQSYVNADEALIAGQQKIYSQYKNN